MHTVGWDRPWLRYLWISVGYAVVFELLGFVFISHWQLTAGFRVACLLLVPRRYWLALIAGEALADSAFVYGCVGRLGLPWGLSVLFVPMMLNMISVGLFRKYRPIIDANKRVVVSSLLLCIFASVIMSTGAEVIEFALMQGLSPEKRFSAAHVDSYSYLWFLGTGLGIYAIVPFALWAYTEDDLNWQSPLSGIVSSPLLLTAVAFLVPSLYVLAHTIVYTHAESLRHIAQVAMLLTPAWFAWRYGWQGASLACMMANLAVVQSMPALYDHTTLQTQTWMMVSSTVWILLGARFSTARFPQTPAQ